MSRISSLLHILSSVSTLLATNLHILPGPYQRKHRRYLSKPGFPSNCSLSYKCECRDWYGQCRLSTEIWTDEDVWNYECKEVNGSDAVVSSCRSPLGEIIPMGGNSTISSLWYSCTQNEKKLVYESEPHCLVNGSTQKVGELSREGRFQWLCLQTGRWVKGCYYSNETHSDILLGLGDKAYNGLVEHTCDHYEDFPGRVQYFTKVRDDVHVKHPSNKGINTNFPQPKDDRISEEVVRWLHESASHFIANDVASWRIVRYLPASRRKLGEHL